MARVLLVFPEPTDEQNADISPPLAILYIGSYLERAGVPVRYLDMRFHTAQDLRAELAQAPSLVGVSSMTGYQLLGALEVLRAVKQALPETPTVLGGVHASILPGQSLANPLVDYVVVGEGEEALLELVESLESGGALDKILGLGWKRPDGELVVNERRPFMDLALAPPPITTTSRALYDHYSFGKVQISRGCPHRCAFCYNTSFNQRKYRNKPLEVVEAEIAAISALRPELKHFTFLSDNIGRNFERTVGIANLARRHGLTFHSAIRAEYLSEKLIAEIDGACQSVFIGVESAVPRLREMLLKDNTMEDVWRAAQMLANSGIQSFYSFMTGFPGETREETLASMDFADKLRQADDKAVVTPFWILTPYPGTKLYEYAVEQGFQEPASLTDWRDFALGKANMPWIDKDSEYYTDLYGISLLAYLDRTKYTSDEFEQAFFTWLQDKARHLWRERKLVFKQELQLFAAYNRTHKSAR